MPTTLIFATANEHKKTEVDKVIDKERYHLVSLTEVGITEDIVEDGDTLEANALIKARYVYHTEGKDVFSEDTGLEVDALGGDPGVITARYAGPQKNAVDNMNLLLKNLAGKTDRTAQFRAVIALIIDGAEVLFEGIVKGTIAHEISGQDGFGYDPIFIPDGHTKTFAELPDEVKLSQSHRTRALTKMTEFLSRRE